MIGWLKSIQYLLETQNVVRMQPSVEFATDPPSDEYRGTCFSSNDKAGLLYSHY